MAASHFSDQEYDDFDPATRDAPGYAPSLYSIIDEYKRTLQTIYTQISPGMERLQLVEKDYNTFTTSLQDMMEGIEIIQNIPETQQFIHPVSAVKQELTRAINHLVVAYGSYQDSLSAGMSAQEVAECRSTNFFYLDQCQKCLAEALGRFL